ncbi:MAG: transposase, partial [Acidobacteriota bacterium]
MKRKRFTEEQIISVLKQAQAGARRADLCRQVGAPGPQIVGRLLVASDKTTETGGYAQKRR